MNEHIMVMRQKSRDGDNVTTSVECECGEFSTEITTTVDKKYEDATSVWSEHLGSSWTAKAKQ